MKILIVTDAWSPQVNGVVRTLQSVRSELEKMGHQVAVISPDQFRSIPCPTYPEIRLALTASVGRRIRGAAADAIHVATEGPLGLAARRHCLKHGCPSPPPTTPNFRNMCRSAPGCRRAGSGATSAGSTKRPRR
jgi:hypothetical protein